MVAWPPDNAQLGHARMRLATTMFRVKSAVCFAIQSRMGTRFGSDMAGPLWEGKTNPHHPRSWAPWPPQRCGRKSCRAPLWGLGGQDRQGTTTTTTTFVRAAANKEVCRIDPPAGPFLASPQVGPALGARRGGGRTFGNRRIANPQTCNPGPRGTSNGGEHGGVNSEGWQREGGPSDDHQDGQLSALP